MSEELKTTWQASLKCENCNYCWKEEILFGYRVVANRIIVDGSDNPLEGADIFCPNCHCTTDVRKEWK